MIVVPKRCAICDADLGTTDVKNAKVRWHCSPTCSFVQYLSDRLDVAEDVLAKVIGSLRKKAQEVRDANRN